MSTATINSTIPHDRLAARLTREIEDLSLEIFTTTYGADWHQAITTALHDLPDLLAYADDWNDSVFALGNPTVSPF